MAAAETMLERERRRRRRVPSPVAIAAAVARGRLAWRDPSRRAAARAAIDAVAGRVDQRDALARQHLIEDAVREELIWRPWQFDGARLDGREHLERALALGRGAIASFVHCGPFPGVAASVIQVSGRVSAAAGGWLWAPDPDPAKDHRRERWLANLEEAGVELIEAWRSFGALAERLATGEVVFLAFDAPGNEETPFLGRRIPLATGAARLAFETGAPVLPVWRNRDRWRPYTVLGAPLFTADHADWRALHEALADLHTRWILSRPAALENPCRPGWWGEGRR